MPLVAHYLWESIYILVIDLFTMGTQTLNSVLKHGIFTNLIEWMLISLKINVVFILFWTLFILYRLFLLVYLLSYFIINSHGLLWGFCIPFQFLIVWPFHLISFFLYIQLNNAVFDYLNPRIRIHLIAQELLSSYNSSFSLNFCRKFGGKVGNHKLVVYFVA